MGYGSRVARRGVLRRLAGLGAGLAAALAPDAGSRAAEPLVLGIFPYLPALQIGRQFGVLAGAFAELCERPVSLRTKGTFPAFRELLLGGHYDIALLHPFLYVDVLGVQDYRPLGRLREDLAAVVIGPATQRLEGFADLRGQALAVPPRLSAVAQLVQHELGRAELAGADGVRLSFYRTKTACLQAVASGAAAACALPPFVLDQVEMLHPVVLEPKFSTPAIPGLLLVAHARLGEPFIRVLRREVLEWGAEPRSRQLLQALGWTGLVAVRPGEYETASLALLVDR